MMKKIKILLAEDNDLTRENLVDLLSEDGYEVTAVRDGKEAMDTFPCDKYDLVITDMKMPHADGLQLLKFIKEISPENIVIMITVTPPWIPPSMPCEWGPLTISPNPSRRILSIWP